MSSPKQYCCQCYYQHLESSLSLSTLQYRSNLKSQGSWSLIEMQMIHMQEMDHPLWRSRTNNKGRKDGSLQEVSWLQSCKATSLQGQREGVPWYPQWKRSISDGKHLPGPGGPSAKTAGQVSRRRGREGGLWLGILPECLGRLRGCVFYTGHHRGWGLCGSHSRTLCRDCKQKDGSWFRAIFWKC